MGLPQQTNGAGILVETLLEGKVDVCFANPGTSEMHFVAALDQADGMRCVLGLFEGVVTGAADGYARMTDRPAATMLHLAPGLANGLANLHNAKRAQVPMVNVVGEHRQGHKVTDSVLTGDIEALARPMSAWVKTCVSANEIARDAAQAIREANSLPGRIATLILPADTAWTQADRPAERPFFEPPLATVPTRERFAAAAGALKSGRPTIMVLSGRALRAAPLQLAGRIAAHTGARIIAQYSNGRIERGAGRVPIERTPAPVDEGLATFKDAAHIILVGAKKPAVLFGYPGKPDWLAPPGANLVELTSASDDLLETLRELAAMVGAQKTAIEVGQARDLPLPTGALTPGAVLRAVAALMPEHAVIVDESVTAGRPFFPLSQSAQPHDYLQLTGGAIGSGPPLATGAAVACPGRKVINMEGDGSSIYTIQALWTQAREKLDVLTIIFANGGYQILKKELVNVGATAWGPRAQSMLSLVNPAISWVKLAEGFGVEAAAAQSAEELVKLMRYALARPGPFLIEARIAAE